MDQSLNNAPGITPPPELVQQWMELSQALAIAAAFQAGADQELEACCEWLDTRIGGIYPGELRANRRPKPPSAVAQAEALIERYEDGWCPSPAQWHVIREGLAEGRRALEQLDG